MTADTWRDQIAATFEIHQLEWIDHDVGWECGCNEYGDLPGMRFLQDALRHQADAVMPILDAAVAEARADTAEAIAKEIPNQSARVIREHEPRPHGCVCGAVFGDDIDRRWHLVNQALAAAADIARNVGSQP